MAIQKSNPNNLRRIADAKEAPNTSSNNSETNDGHLINLPASALTTGSDFEGDCDTTSRTAASAADAAVLPSESEVAAQISALWLKQKMSKDAVRHTRKELSEIRVKLGAHLFTYKAILAKAGRHGGWAAFLRESGIPLSTGDSYVTRHEQILRRSNPNVPAQEVRPPTDEEVIKRARRMLPTLNAFHTDSRSAELLLAELRSGLSALHEGRRDVAA